MRSSVNHISCTCVRTLVQRFPNSNVTFNGHKHSRLVRRTPCMPFGLFIYLFCSCTKLTDHRNMYHKCHHLGARLRSSFFLFICKDTPCSVNVAKANQGISVATQFSVDVRVAFVLKQHHIFFFVALSSNSFSAHKFTNRSQLK